MPVGSYIDLKNPDPRLLKSISLYDIADWTFRKKGKLQGGFRRKAEAEAEAGDK